MSGRQDNLVWMAVGGFGALILAVLLVPLRTLTSASNLAFAFLAFTIVIAEVGGRSAALLTAVVSAMSLNFFLTEPYLTLAITKSDDLVAFLALAICGLIAAAFGRRRERLSDAAARAGEELSILKDLVDQLRGGKPLGGILRELARRFKLGAIVLRDSKGQIVAATPSDKTPLSSPTVALAADTLFPLDEKRLEFGVSGLRLPEGGGRLSFRTARGDVSVDLWEGDPSGFGVDEGRTLAIAGSMLALELSRRGSA